MNLTNRVAQARSTLLQSQAARRAMLLAVRLRRRWSRSLALQVYTMLIPLAICGLWVGVAAWNGMQRNASDVLEARRVKEDLLALHGLMLAQSDSSKAMILHPEDDSANAVKIRAFDAHEALLASLDARTHRMPSIHAGLLQLRRVHDTSIQPADMEIVEALAVGNTKQAQDVYRSRYSPAKKRYEGILQKLIEDAEVRAQAANRIMAQRNTGSLVQIIFALICGFGAATAGLVFVLRQRVLQPLLQVKTALGAVSSGDFTVQLSIPNRNELGQTARAVNHMVRSVRESMSGMAAESQIMAAQSDRLHSISESMLGEVRGVADNCTALSALGAEVASNIRETSDYLRTISESVDGVSTKAQESARRIAAAQMLSHRTNEAVQHLKQSTAAIDEIADFIVRLTFETNILALNASIEAARYGEAGAGFRVIAQQVKGLADQTKSATGQISGHVVKIGQDVTAGVLAMREMKQVLDGVTEISAAVALETENQNRATQALNETVCILAGSGDHIAQSLQKMAAAIAQTTALAHETRESAVEVSDCSSTLDRLLSRFDSA